MKKLLYAAFCLVLTLGIGCAVTNYELMQDGYNGEIENTNGPALMEQGIQTATTWPDGSDNVQWFVDQKANGDRALTNVNYFTTDGSLFVDYMYCTPDSNGCSTVSASDPEVGDVSIFDFKFNPNCSGSRSLVYVVSTTRYYGECGRAVKAFDKMRLMAMLNWDAPDKASAVFGRNNFALKLVGQDLSSLALPMHGTIPVAIDFGARTARVDATNPVLGTVAARAGQFIREHGPAFSVEARVNGITVQRDNLFKPEVFGNLADRF